MTNQARVSRLALSSMRTRLTTALRIALAANMHLSIASLRWERWEKGEEEGEEEREEERERKSVT